ncbi:hypothetical protein [Massilia sp. erpn]|uniref:hypothetical protein n=1 Tax=Massilia sp. erpn TaxID=2738142 RepID=UPI0021026904|nr:hypothetical protein [Massilia sp. erpn]UTY59053.1 hypothetical protein HPQ68_18845 [Massilia sp. erpn]
MKPGLKHSGWQFALEAATLDCTSESYVGLVRNTDGSASLRLPYGYRLRPDESKEHGLGHLSRVLARFAREYPKENTSKRDGYLKAAQGQATQASREQDLDYSKLASHIALIRRMSDPSLLAQVRAPGLAPGFDARYISRNLERATYLPDHTPYFDTMLAQPVRLQRTSTDLVGLACWIALDALHHLFPAAGQEIAPSLLEEWETLAARFADSQHLPKDASLFGAGHHTTLAQLQDAFDAATCSAPPIHAEARELAHTLEQLLHCSASANGGDIFGLKGFYRVWEAACLNYALAHFGAERILCCDHELLHQATPAQRQRWTRVRHELFAWNGTARRPDLVVEGEEGRLLLIDFKYSAAYAQDAFFHTRPAAPSTRQQPKTWQDWRRFCEQAKLQQDIASLEAYRWLLMQHHLKSHEESRIDVEIWVPGEENGLRSCAWQAWGETGRLPGTAFHQLAVRTQATADILQHYTAGFSLFA